MYRNEINCLIKLNYYDNNFITLYIYSLGFRVREHRYK